MVRVVIPRSVRCVDAQRTMWRAWQHGFSSRVTSTVQPEGWLLVEFLLDVRPQVHDGLEAFEIELEDALRPRHGGPRIVGSGSRLEAT